MSVKIINYRHTPALREEWVLTTDPHWRNMGKFKRAGVEYEVREIDDTVGNGPGPADVDRIYYVMPMPIS